MRSRSYSFSRPFAAYLSAITLAATCWLAASAAFASNATNSNTHAAASAKRQLLHVPPLPRQRDRVSPRVEPRVTPSFAFLPQIARPSPRLGPADEIATLHAINQALSLVGDGDAYIWRRGNGALTGLIRPTTSFTSSSGRVCRHIVIKLSSGLYSRNIEGVACRSNDGVWSLSG